MASGPPSRFPEEVTSLSFFFSDFANSDEAASYVINHSTGRGSFVLRPSSRIQGMLTLTISTDENIARHINVQMREDDRSATHLSFYIIPERTFPTFHDLYIYYSLNNICNLENVSNVKLLNPLNRADTPQAQGPCVMPDEIPPLPRKSSQSSGIGTDSVSQQGLPEIPRIGSRSDRPSLDSQGNDLRWGSNSSSGSGAAMARRSLPTTNGQDFQIPEYLAPKPPNAEGASLGAQAFSTPMIGLRPFFSLSNLCGPSTSTGTPLSKKEQKLLKDQQKKKEKEEKKMLKEKMKTEKKSKVEPTGNMHQMLELGWCRPPIPIPQSASLPEEETPYYTSPRPYKNHLEDLKKMLRETDTCDCGLRMMDAELVQGWTVHRSREEATHFRVFYQHEDGNTTWDLPEAITDNLTDTQVTFIVRLCKEGNQSVPRPLLRRYDRMSGGPRVGSLPSTSSLNSSRSRSGSTSSDRLGSSLPSSRSHVMGPRSLPGPGGS
ncbi:uncharacterized protein LOC143299509 [Babylonia areolata]|uniref:uncharacterized protein LOC143299509 n=1 Tax=Babylonia areolata TaxID=304850 RepID=UPI003FCF3EBE